MRELQIRAEKFLYPTREQQVQAEKYFWMMVAVMLCFTASSALASMGGGFPTIGNFMNMLKETVTGPVAAACFAFGICKCGWNCHKAGGMDGLGEGGLGTASMGALLGGYPYMSSLFGISGAMIA